MGSRDRDHLYADRPQCLLHVEAQCTHWLTAQWVPPVCHTMLQTLGILKPTWLTRLCPWGTCIPAAEARDIFKKKYFPKMRIIGNGDVFRQEKDPSKIIRGCRGLTFRVAREGGMWGDTWRRRDRTAWPFIRRLSIQIKVISEDLEWKGCPESRSFMRRGIAGTEWMGEFREKITMDPVQPDHVDL